MSVSAIQDTITGARGGGGPTEMSKTTKSNDTPNAAAEPLPSHRPLERFWPYVEPSPLPSPEELAALDPDLRAALFGGDEQPFSITIVFPKLPDQATYQAAVALARATSDYREVGTGETIRHRARYVPSEAVALRDLFDLVGSDEACEVLIDDRPLPYARELWLPLVWFLIPR